MNRLVILAACGLLVAASGASQTPQTPPIFRASTDLVEVDAVVQDRSGRFVRGLTSDDFVLLENGKPQPIELVSLVESNAATIAAAAPESAPAADQPVRRRRVFVVVFDDRHLVPASFSRVQAAAVSLFSTQLQPGDLGGVVIGGQIVNRRLTPDAAELVSIVRNARPNADASVLANELRQWPRLTEPEIMLIDGADRDALESAVRRACNEDSSSCPPGQGDELARQAVQAKAPRMAAELRASTDRILHVVSALLSSFDRIEGRKSIVLLSEGFVAQDSIPLLRDTVSLAARVNARIYTLDARGLGRQGASVEGTAPDDAATRMLASFDSAADAVNSLSVDTGGFVVRNTNDFGRAMAQIAQDTGTYYVIGFRPSGPRDGTYHRVAVSVKRPDLVVRARRGYIATPTPAGAVLSSPPPVPSAPAAPAPPPAPASLEAPSPAPIDAMVLPGAARDVASESAPAGSAMRVRPLAERHVDDLSVGDAADPDAEAGWDAYQRGDLETARTALSAAARRPTAQSWVRYALGQAHYALTQYRDAVREWESVRSTNADFEPVYFDLVDGYLQLKDYERATRVLRAAKERWSHDPDVFNALGVVHNKRGSLDDAIKAFQDAIDAAPDEPTSYLNLGVAFEQRYIRSRHWVPKSRVWLAKESDRADAIANYRRYLAFGGPYVAAARDGLTRLNWVPKP